MQRSKCVSFDYILGAPEEGEREADTERLGGRRQSGTLTALRSSSA
jgi:hypothetical protein